MKTLTITDIMVDFLDSIRAYEHESGKSIHFDERESSEFVYIYFNKKNKNNMIQRKAEKWGVNAESPIEKIKREAYNEGFRAGRNYIKNSVNLTVSNDALAASFQTLGQYRETLIKWIETL